MGFDMRYRNPGRIIRRVEIQRRRAMRYAFGLGGMLIVIVVIVWIMGASGGELDEAKSAIDARNKVDPQIKQWSGKAPDGSSAKDSATLQAQTDNSGKLRGLLVADIVPGGAYA